VISIKFSEIDAMKINTQKSLLDTFPVDLEIYDAFIKAGVAEADA